MTTQPDFLSQLQDQAKLQAKLSMSHILPPQLDRLTVIIGNYPWQFLVVSSGITALLVFIAGQR